LGKKKKRKEAATLPEASDYHEDKVTTEAVREAHVENA
jgi:hypothetical protein